MDINYRSEYWTYQNSRHLSQINQSAYDDFRIKRKTRDYISVGDSFLSKPKESPHTSAEKLKPTLFWDK